MRLNSQRAPLTEKIPYHLFPTLLGAQVDFLGWGDSSTRLPYFQGAIQKQHILNGNTSYSLTFAFVNQQCYPTSRRTFTQYTKSYVTFHTCILGSRKKVRGLELPLPRRTPRKITQGKAGYLYMFSFLVCWVISNLINRGIFLMQQVDLGVCVIQNMFKQVLQQMAFYLFSFGVIEKLSFRSLTCCEVMGIFGLGLRQRKIILLEFIYAVWYY
eukprot:TRINITY_DN21914_c1_g1_i1.p3 TRINITY_DN21914_c1_g1~~TRINITY_DN21914_c1_g1_i1.p3  ORF type:complete len:213 (-),score=-1.54 TRINITY_DN21914_c1_g1_i1:299-937(-)